MKPSSFAYHRPTSVDEVDINHIVHLGSVRVDDAGVDVGATARHRDLEHDDEAADEVAPLLRGALRYVAHPTIRNRGKAVGSLRSRSALVVRPRRPLAR